MKIKTGIKQGDYMFSKINKTIIEMFKKIGILKRFIIAKPSLKIVYIVIFILLFTVFLFFYGWLWQFKFRGIVDLNILLMLIGSIVGATALISWLSSALVDKNKNNIPDIFEKENENKRGDSH